MTRRERMLIEWDDGGIVESGPDEFHLVSPDGQTQIFPSLAEALEATEQLQASWINYVLPLTDLIDVLDEAGMDAFFPGCDDGLVRWDSWLVPVRMHPEHGYPGEGAVYVGSVGEHGCWVEVYRWQHVYMLCAVAPEGTDATWQIVDDFGDDGALSYARDVLDDFLAEYDLDFDDTMGLVNLSVEKQYELPAGAVPWRSYSSYFAWAESLIADLTVHREPLGAGHRYTVTRVGATTVIGSFESREEFESAIDVEPGCTVEWYDL